MNALNSVASTAAEVSEAPEVVNAAAVETVIGEAVTVLRLLKVSIKAEVATKTNGVATRAHAKIKMALSSKARKLSEEVAEAVAETTRVVAEATEVIEEVMLRGEIAATTEAEATKEAALVPRRRERPNQLSNNNKLSERFEQ